jgi:magnesium transporter
MTIVDCAVYEDGCRREGDLPLDAAGDAAQAEDSFVWIGLYEPSEEEFDAVTREFHLHELAVEDAINAHQRPTRCSWCSRPSATWTARTTSRPARS